MKLSEIKLKCPKCNKEIPVEDWIDSLESKEWGGDGLIYDCAGCLKWSHWSQLEVVNE